MCCFSFRRGFLQKVASTRDRRRKGTSPLRGKQTVVLDLRGIFAPFHRRQSWHWSTWGSHTSPQPSRCSCLWTCPFVECCSILDLVEAFLRSCLLRISFWDFLMPPLAFWPLECSRSCDHGCMMQGSITPDPCLLPSLMVGSCWVGLIFVCSFDITPIALANKVLVHLVLPRCEVVFV